MVWWQRPMAAANGHYAGLRSPLDAPTASVAVVSVATQQPLALGSDIVRLIAFEPRNGS